ncbi:MAG: caspase family protein [Drouetiella hepatica Uher 2000/2452]|jgi:uncharacterized caspase-like protein|uniref:Caspase family protein n=1 Tax=Drouetiella hepatica Uher 2000/2452 TaxID=904376 RepID=A0A951UKR4_9CYAN|nr:caspase family protein [Drouetiella hepatica Uher 2000/2452]
MCPLSLKTSDSTQILATGKAKMWILLVGVNQYQDEHFPALDYSAIDCQQLGAALNEATREFPRKQVIVHHDFAAFPTFAAVYSSLKQITSAAQPQDTVLFYFSGHGVIEQTTQQAVLCLSDTQNDSLLTTGLKMQELLQLLEGCAARHQLLWLDACHSGSLVLRGARGMDEPTAIGSFEPTVQLVKVLRTRAAQSRGFYALLSCDEGQRSWEFPELGHGVFTYYLIQGLRGDAADAQGVIEADALYRYVYRQTVEYLNQKNYQLRLINEEKKLRKESPLHPEYPLQTPKRIVEGVGELVLGLLSESSDISGADISGAGISGAGISGTGISGTGISTATALVAADRPGNDKAELSETRFAQNFAHNEAHNEASPTRTPISAPVNPPSSPDSQIGVSKAVPQSESTLVALKQLSVFGYAGITLAILGAGFALGGLTGLFNPHLFTSLNPAGENAENAEACDRPLETLPGSKQPMEAQLLLPNCAAGAGWEQVKVQTFIGRLGAAWWVALTSDGNTLASVSGNAVEVRDLQTGETLRVLKGHKDIIHAIAISPDGKTLATGSADKTIKLWDLQTGELLQTLVGHAGVIWSLAFHPNGQILTSGGGDSTIRLWDVQTGQLSRTISGHKDRLFPVVFSPDGSILASGSKDTTIKLWNWQTGKMLRNLPGHTDTVRALVFDAKGERLASGSWDGTVKLWDVQSGEELNTFTGHINNVVSVAFSPDDKTLASGGIDNTVKLWDLENQTLLATLKGHLDWILSVTFSPDGKTLVSGGRDGTVAVWKLQP